MKKTKIVCTLGPASQDEKTMERMLKAGMNVARLNFSHGSHDSHKVTIETFRRVRDRLQIPAAVMLDTRGPEIRIGIFEEGYADLQDGSVFTFTTEQILGNSERVSITYPELPSQLEPGDRLILDDGNIQVKVIECTETDIKCSVEDGGILKDRKGINIPAKKLKMEYLSEQDTKDVIFGVENDVDFIAASFVRKKDDVVQLRKLLDFHGGHSVRIISKIENMEGIENFEEILACSDGIMIARGDMGVEIQYERLPGIQKRFIKACYRAGKMAITATQMLESMIVNPYPTRAEITDVANAVFDGTSAIMLSGESAAGKHPVRAVEVMVKIARQAERDAFSMDLYNKVVYDMDAADTTNAICDAACTTARDINAKAIIVVTKSGQAARRMSKFRPSEPIVAATPVIKTYHQLSLSWGVQPVYAREQQTPDTLFMHAIDCAKQIDIVKNGDVVVITAGVPLGVSGTTNTLKVQTVGDFRTSPTGY